MEKKMKKLNTHHQNAPRFVFHWTLLFFSASVSAISITTTAAPQPFDYADALAKSLLYFEFQRSGRLPYNQRVTWRDHSGLTDGLEQGVDLVGGYYDAGDHVKFGLPMAFTAHTSPNVLWAEVGDGDTDHYCWQRPEDMTTSRQAYKIDQNNPGSDLAGETAAAMAAASITFKKTNPYYSHLLLHHAQELFEFGDKYRGKYDGSVAVAKSYYASVIGYMDELLWAAVWLFEATDKEEYLNYVVDNGGSFGGIGWAISEFSWDVKYAGVQIMASKIDAKLNPINTNKILHESETCKNTKYDTDDNVDRSPGGLLYVRQWNNMQYVTTAAFLLTIYSDFLRDSNQNLHCPSGTVDHEESLSFAKSQVDYILGSNPMNMSYLVGYGSKYPTRVHHRGASIMSYRENKGFIGCTQGYDHCYNRAEANPNVLVGAVVGGPDIDDNFGDQRDNYMQTEACIYNTAPLVGVFAKLLHLKESHELELVASY
ncbi:Endoglucanase 11 [Hibiscus syriacus]|uniref:Endoglucanase n=1 Tax=Hibiscus syriacus TaxID=106335 RepID=A0A6A2ZVC5_HIBSY|nr:Endoglucanase 11 [Hibiscus syriacus]